MTVSPLDPIEVNVHCYVPIKPQNLWERFWLRVWPRMLPYESEHRVIRMLAAEFEMNRVTFETMVILGFATVQVEHACGCVFDVRRHTMTGRMCDHHWWDWILEQVATAKQWERIR